MVCKFRIQEHNLFVTNQPHFGENDVIKFRKKTLLKYILKDDYLFKFLDK
jgi:hypothetical protein